MKLKNMIQVMLDEYIQDELNKPGEMKDKFKNIDDFNNPDTLIEMIKELINHKNKSNKENENC